MNTNERKTKIIANLDGAQAIPQINALIEQASGTVCVPNYDQTLITAAKMLPEEEVNSKAGIAVLNALGKIYGNYGCLRHSVKQVKASNEILMNHLRSKGYLTWINHKRLEKNGEILNKGGTTVIGVFNGSELVAAATIRCRPQERFCKAIGLHFALVRVTTHIRLMSNPETKEIYEKIILAQKELASDE